METTKDARSYRLANIDMLRGVVILIMALDHVRDYFLVGGIQDPMLQPNPDLALYLTRWITHFCAPVFVFLAGTSAGLMYARKTKHQLAQFLAKRGLWLIAVEVVLISTAFTFAPLGLNQLNGGILVIMQVLWAIGASMVVLSLFQYLGRNSCLALGIFIIAAQHLLEPIWPASSLSFSNDNPVWWALYAQSTSINQPFIVVFAYPLLPWIGIMLFGFGASTLFEKPKQYQNRQLKVLGLAMILVFLILRFFDVYGDANQWHVHAGQVQATVLDFFNVSKYPPSLLFTLITLGPMAVLLAFSSKWQNRFTDTLVMFGRVPFVFYVAHFYLIHALAVVYGYYSGFEPMQFMTIFFFFPQGYGTNLFGVYLVWVIVIALLYPLCRWMAELKSKRKDWWLSYC